MVLSSSSRSLIMLWGKWQGVWETQIKELALTGKQFLKTNTSQVSALEVSFFLLREDFLEWAIEVGCWLFFVLFFLYIYIYMYTLSDQRSWAVSYFALIINKRYSVQLLTTQKPLNRPGWWKGKFALFQMPATAGECRHLSRGWLSPPPPHTLASSGARAFTDRRRGLNAKTA